MTLRELKTVVPSVATSDGAGVKLRRSLGASQSLRHDPFLMLDEFFSDNPDDYLAGFPPHPHRGFETVTYMLDGHMRHEDNFGNTGDLGPGALQWMTAAAGIIHSEMPQQSEGRMRGFQLWINLPASEKLKPAAYRDIPASAIPTVKLANGVRVKVLAGRLLQDSQVTSGPVNGTPGAVGTDPHYFDVILPAEATFETAVPSGHNAFLYVYEGAAAVGAAARPVPHRAAGLLSDGDAVRIRAGSEGAGVLLLAGKPLREPIVQYGPFVMNTREQIEQAMADYQRGTLTKDEIQRIKTA